MRRLYRRLDEVIGDLFDRYGSQATILVMSDHGFANFGRQFDLNLWLRENGYLGPAGCTSIMRDVDWGWLIRYMHSTGASAFFIVVYLHMFQSPDWGLGAAISVMLVVVVALLMALLLRFARPAAFRAAR